MEEPLAGNFDDHTFRPEKIHLAPDVVGHKLADGAVRQPDKLFLQNRTDAERADHPLKGILRVCEAPLFFDEVFDFFLSAVVDVHALQLYPVEARNR